MIKQFAAAIVLAATSAAAFATDTTTGFFIGADAGKTRVESSNKDNSFGIFGGYRINRFIAFEGGYRDMGKYAFSTYSYNPVTRRYDYSSVNVGMKQAALSAVASLPMGRFSLYSRVGFNSLSADTGNVSNIESGALLGAGAALAITDNLSVRVEFQKAATDVENVSAGLSWKF